MTGDSVDAAAVLRAEILAQHASLRVLSTRLTDCARRVLEKDSGATEGLARLVEELLGTLTSHMAFEERSLVPLLRQIDPWGSERAARLLEEHVRQREVLATMRSEAAIRPASELALAAQTLVADVLEDMKYEERDYLSPDVLRDGLVVPDQDTG